MKAGEIENSVDLLLLDNPRFKAARFVIGNLPEISVLKDMAQNNTTRVITIGNKKWNLHILDNDDSKTKEITFIEDVDIKQKPRFGISVDRELKWALGSIAGSAPFPFIKPFRLTKLMEKFEEDNAKLVKESLAKNSESEIAIALRLSPEHVSRLASQFTSPKT